MDERSYKRFAGEEDDPGKGLNKWRAWALAKMADAQFGQESARALGVYTVGTRFPRRDVSRGRREEAVETA